MSTTQNNYNIAAIQVADKTTADPNKYFNNFFSPSFQISSGVDSAILSYFESVTNDRASAKVLASAVIYTSYTRGLEPMVVLSEFAALPKGELTAYLTMFLNLQRVGTSFLGMSTQPIANKYVKRSILG